MTHSPSCNGSQQESQKLTGDDCTETPTPRTDGFTRSLYDEACAHAAGMGGNDRSPEEGYGLAIAFARQLERELNAKSRELEEARKDAERYRWLRSTENVYPNPFIAVRGMNGSVVLQVMGQTADVEIDKALLHDIPAPEQFRPLEPPILEGI